jgi:hypothetical protein
LPDAAPPNRKPAELAKCSSDRSGVYAGEYTVREIRLNRRFFIELRKRRIAAMAQIEQTRRSIARLRAEQQPKHDIIAELEDKIAELADRFINPKVPYEAEDLIVE